MPDHLRTVEERLQWVEDRLHELGVGLTVFLVELMDGQGGSAIVAARTLKEAQEAMASAYGDAWLRADVQYLGNAMRQYQYATIIRYFHGIGESYVKP